MEELNVKEFKISSRSNVAMAACAFSMHANVNNTKMMC